MALLPLPVLSLRTSALLIDRHPLFREGLELLLGREFPQWQIVQAGTLIEALAHLDRDPAIALVLLDLELPESNGLAGLVRLRQRAARPRYVVMSGSDCESSTRAAIEHGAVGYIPKTARTSTMLTALRTVLAGRIYLPAHLDAALIGTPAAPMASAPEALGMSSRQIDVLRQLVEGKRNKDICRALGISESTVKTHLVTIFRKLGASSRTQAVVAATRLGFRLHALPEPG